VQRSQRFCLFVFHFSGQALQSFDSRDRIPPSSEVPTLSDKFWSEETIK